MQLSVCIPIIKARKQSCQILLKKLLKSYQKLLKIVTKKLKKLHKSYQKFLKIFIKISKKFEMLDNVRSVIIDIVNTIDKYYHVRCVFYIL